MRISRQMRAHELEMARLRRTQICKVRQEALRRGHGVRSLGRLIGKTEIRGWQEVDWDPPQDLLNVLEEALFEGDPGPREPLVSARITSRRIMRALAPGHLRAVEIWNRFDGAWSDAVAVALASEGILGQSTMLVDREEGMFVESRGDEMSIWPRDRQNTGVFLFDRPDPEWNEFVFRRVMVPLSTGEPYIDRCRGWSELVGRNLRYVACLLPFTSTGAGAPDRVLSVVTSDRGTSPASVHG